MRLTVARHHLVLVVASRASRDSFSVTLPFIKDRFCALPVLWEISTLLSSADQALLQRALRGNRCVLFLGAGFSSGSENELGTTVPGAWDLARQLWLWLGYEDKYGPYENAQLDRLFDNARKAKGDAAVLDFLRVRLTITKVPEWYKTVAYPYWYRMYTTNVDDLVERVFRKSATARLDVISGIRERYRERDSYLESLQYIKLNGSLHEGLDFITFGARQYAKRASEYGVWYDQFVRDYSTHCTVLIGSRVNEPLFWQALETRQGRHGAPQELRLRSFLVSDRISPEVLDSLSEFNVVPVRTEASKFFEYLESLIGDIPSHEEMLLQVNPHIATFLPLASGAGDHVEATKAFFAVFKRVEVQDPPTVHRSLYHNGATPEWEDLALGLDAQREVTAEAFDRVAEALEAGSAFRSFLITGHRGAGKSSLLMRTSLNLSAAGYLVFFALGEDLPEPHIIARAVDVLGRKVALFVDDAEWIVSRLAILVKELRRLRNPPVLLCALRANVLHAVNEADIGEQIELGELTEKDIDAVIAVLSHANSLGVMTGEPPDTIREAFRVRARKQLLVAMKEVTTGRDFDAIIRQEYHDVVDSELRLSYLIACLATAAGASLTRGQLLSSSELPPATLLSALGRELRQLIVYVAEEGERVVARHPVIALSVIERAAPKSALSSAYKRLLSVLANQMDSHAKRGEARRWFRLYKHLVNHREIFLRFERDIEEARTIFDTLMPKLVSDAHFWLQYGSLELEYGELDLAARYLTTAEGLAPNDFLVRNTKAHLLFAQAIAGRTLAEAVELRREAESLVDEIIAESGEHSNYPWHILISHQLKWLEIWEHSGNARRTELDQLRKRAAEACEARPRSDELQKLKQKVERAYLETAV